MSITVTELLTRFTADTSNLNAGVAGANQQVGAFQNATNSTLGTLRSVGSVALGVAGGGLLALGAGMVGVGASGLSLNSSMENVTAQLNAFTKDGAKSAEILDMIRERAAKTPFEFNEMARATAGLLPAAKASGEGLESLVEKAEILAASNPAQGLEGAAFSLREAVSGDFTSIIERFNLPRQFINKLKEEGVPALEIVQRAMKEVGFDTDLVANLAETADGRWSTFKDTFQGFAATITQPIFDSFSAGLGVVNKWLSDNEPLLSRTATAIGGALKGAMDAIASVMPSIDDLLSGLVGGFTSLVEIVSGVIQVFSEYVQSGELLSASEFGLSDSIASVVDSIVDFVLMIWDGINAVVEFVRPIIEAVGQFVSWQDVMTALGVAVAAVVIPAILTFLATLLPIIAIIGGVIAVVSLLRHAWEEDWGGIREKTAAVWEWLKATFEAVAEWLSKNLPGYLAQLQEAWETAWPVIQETFSAVWDFLVAAWNAGVEFFAQTLPDAIETLRRGWESGWNGIKSFFTTVWDGIKAIFDTLQTWLTVTVPDAINSLYTKAQTEFENIRSAIVGKIDAIISTLSSLQSWIADKVTDAINGLKNLLSGMVLSNPFQAMVTALTNLGTALANAKTIIISWVEWIRNLHIPNPFSTLSLPSWMGGGNSNNSANQNGAGGGFSGGSSNGGNFTPRLPLDNGGSGSFGVDSLAQAIVRAFAQAPPLVRAEFAITVSGTNDVEGVSYEMARRVSEIIQRRAT